MTPHKGVNVNVLHGDGLMILDRGYIGISDMLAVEYHDQSASEGPDDLAILQYHTGIFAQSQADVPRVRGNDLHQSTEASPFYEMTVDDDVLDQIFNVYVRDFSRYALDIYGKATSTEAQKEQCLKMIKSPVVDKEKFDRVLEKNVYSLVDEYIMNP